MRRALTAGEFSVAYQPILQTTDGCIIGVEALLRWMTAAGCDYAQGYLYCRPIPATSIRKHLAAGFLPPQSNRTPRC